MLVKKKKKLSTGLITKIIVWRPKSFLYIYVHCHKWLHIAKGWKVMYYGYHGKTLQIENIIINGESINQRFSNRIQQEVHVALIIFFFYSSKINVQ